MDYPPLVRQALDAARRLGFPTARADAGGVIGEIGTGTGFSTAWLASAMPETTRLVSVEYDQERARAAAEIFAADQRVTVIHGDANQVIPRHAPFDLLFADGGWREPSTLPDLLKPGGRLIVDDRLVSAEIVLPDLENAILVGTRRA